MEGYLWVDEGMLIWSPCEAGRQGRQGSQINIYRKARCGRWRKQVALRGSKAAECHGQTRTSLSSWLPPARADNRAKQRTRSNPPSQAMSRRVSFVLGTSGWVG